MMHHLSMLNAQKNLPRVLLGKIVCVHVRHLLLRSVCLSLQLYARKVRNVLDHGSRYHRPRFELRP